MKFMTNIKTLTALLIAGAAFAACSSSDEIIEQPANPTAPKVYTMVIKASKGGDATTRALKLTGEGDKTLSAYWSGNETIEVEQNGETIGSASAAPSSNGETTITATLTSAPDPTKDLNFYLCGSNYDYTGQVGLLTGTNSISEKYDYAMDCLTDNSYIVNGSNVTPKSDGRTLNFGAVQQAIIKFTLKNSDGSALPSNPTAFTVTDGDKTVELTSIPANTYTANGDGVLYVAFPASGQAKTITLTATVGSDTYTYTTSETKTFALGKYYEITVKMTKQAPATTTVTWNSSNVFVGENENEKVRMCERTFEGIKMSSYGTESYLYPYDENYGTATLIHDEMDGETFTFTAPDGMLFTKIEIINNDDFEFEEYDDWTKPDDGKIEWNGDASNTVTLGGWESWSCLDLNSIVFTLKDE